MVFNARGIYKGYKKQRETNKYNCYDADTLKLEYERDAEKGMNPQVPVNYFPGDDPSKQPVVNWRAAGQLLWTNWINYYVYQTTPYDINEVENES